MELHDVSYGIEYVARPLLLFFFSENQLLWFRYREYDLAHLNLGKARMETLLGKDYILLPFWTTDPPFSQFCKNSESIDQEKEDNVNSTNNVNAASTNEVNAIGGKTSIELPDDPNMPALEDICVLCKITSKPFSTTVSHPPLHAIQLFDLVPYTDSDYAGASLDRKSTTGGCQFLGSRLISWQCKKLDLWEVQLQALVDGKKIIVNEASVRRDLQLNDKEGTDSLPNATIFEELTRMGYEKFYEAYISEGILLNLSGNSFIQYILQCLSAKTTAWNEFSSTMASAIILFLEKQPKGMQSHKRIYVTPSYTKNIFGNMRRVGKGFSGRETPLFPTMMVQAQEEMGEETKIKEGQRIRDTEVPQNCAPPPTTLNQTGWQLRPVYGVEMDDSLEKVATTTTRLDVEQYRDSGPRRQETMGDTIAQTGFENVFKLFNNSLLARGINLVNTHFDADTNMFGVHYLVGDEVVVETKVASKDVNLRVDEVTLAQALAALKSAKPKADKVMLQEPEQGTITTTTVAKTVTATSIRPKAKGLVIHEDEQATTPTVSSQQPSQVKAQDKGKGIMVEEPVKMKKKDQISLDEELAFKLQAEEEEERLAREKSQREEEANIVAWDNVQAMIDVDYQMASNKFKQKKRKC
ncbi:hypothetical protein Tco_0657192 [Tanacetum coccineum]|uniref:Uncharacterized protein n=1 Tax=Tanacetum coccineum TaxID=301880 RepID=A0ABQ4XBN5_9ASTR